LTPPNTSCEQNNAAALPADALKAGAGQTAEDGLMPLILRLAAEFGADVKTLACVGALCDAASRNAADIFVPVNAALTTALQRLAVADNADSAARAVYAALGEWALDAENEPIERLRGDCLRFQNVLTRACLRLDAGNTDQCMQNLLALQRFGFLQTALLASLAARSQSEGGVVRTLPTPEYAAFMEIFRSTIERHRAEGRQLGLIVLQIAKVEQVDRLLGLQKGEAFMLRIAQRMREGVLRKGDQLGRISRDQFACLLPDIAGEGVAILAANKILDALEMPVPIGNRAFDTDAVAGIAVYPDHGADQQGLVRNAKLAAAVARGLPERTAVYAIEQGAEEERNIHLEMRLRHALEQGTLELAFSPQLDLRSGRIAALTCGLHWHDAELGVLSEDAAMQAAERAGLARELTWWLYNNALRQYAAFAEAGITLPFALKLTASGVTQPDFADFLDRALRTWKTPLKRLTIEVHESALPIATEELKTTLARLKKLGVRLCIDGLGTASVSLSSLAQLPLDEVKIGATFVGNNEQKIFHVKVVRLLANLAKSLDLTVTAEGIKDANTAQALAALGCERVQGAHVGRALSAAEVLACRFDGGDAAVLPFGPAL